MIHLTADWHLGHANIIRHCNRPFVSIDEHDAAIIDACNAVVAPTDTLYMVGDFALSHAWSKSDKPGQQARIAAYRARVRCRQVILIMGNHDPHTRDGEPRPWLRQYFSAVHQILRVNATVGARPVKAVLCHYAMKRWPSRHHGALHWFGHSHGSLSDPEPGSADVGVDVVARWFGRYRPMTIDEAVGLCEESTARYNALGIARPAELSPDGGVPLTSG